MNTEEKRETFKLELSLIKDQRVKNFAEKAIETLPDYFFVMPASTTGKYHPPYAIGDGGLLRHTKAAIAIATDLFVLDEYNFEGNIKDLIIAALILHDGWKKGDGSTQWTVDVHPKFAVDELNKNPKLLATLTPDEVEIITCSIRSHMGKWNKDRSGNEILPKPQTKYEKFVHLVDYLASRKRLEVNFDIPIRIE